MRSRAALFVLAAAACSSQSSGVPLLRLDRPTDVAFACIETTGGVNQALPPAACVTPATPDAGPDSGTGTPDASVRPLTTNVAFVIEQARGDVSVANLDNSSFVDSDKFAPGQNGIPVGRLPASVATTQNGCHVVVANAASCDLSVVNVVNAFQSRPDSVHFLQVKSASGQRILAQPTTVLAAPSLLEETEPSDCTNAAGSVYVAFPGCNLVARVDLATGNILDGVRYRSGAQPELVGGDVTCPQECGAAAPALLPQAEGNDGGVPDAPLADAPLADAGARDAGADATPPPDGGPLPTVLAHPMALAFETDRSRLYIGAHDAPALLVADLDSSGKATALRQVPLEGVIGIKRIAASGDVRIGQDPISGPLRRYVYVIGVDQAIHVIDVTAGRPPFECETQVDRRYLHGADDPELFACFPIGAPETPPRRADAIGPAIRLPRGVSPLDIAFTRANLGLMGAGRPSPTLLNGTFAVVTAIGPVVESRLGRGVAYIINVDDDNYEDFEDEQDISRPDIALALPHTLRDGNLQRRVGRSGCVETPITRGDIGPVRLADTPTRQTGFTYADNGLPGDPFAPGLHRVICDAQNAVWELQMFSPPAVRAELFADLERTAPRAVAGGSATDETFDVAWEGQLAFENSVARKAGGRVVVEDQGSMTLHAPGGQFCSLGMKKADIVELSGCERDSDCAVGEVCTLHPDAPAGVLGMCLREDRAIELTSACKRIMTTVRRYTAIEVGDDHAVIAPRPYVLEASPIFGCTSADQCVLVEEDVLADLESRSSLAAGSLQRHNFTCELDEFMGGPARCIITSIKKTDVPAACTADAHCDGGSVCEGGRCVLGPVPPPVCFDALQRFQPHAGDSFVVTSSQQSFPRRQIMDPTSRLCVDDPKASPLVGNRIRRIEPDCTDTSVTGTSPNPCHLVGLEEPYTTEEGGLALRPAYGIRMRGPGFSFDITDVAAPLRKYPDVLVSTIPYGFAFRFTIQGGFFPHVIPLNAPFPERVKPATDGALWVVDSGDSAAGTRGQLINMRNVGSIGDVRLR